MKLGPLVSPCQWHPPAQLIPAFPAPLKETCHRLPYSSIKCHRPETAPACWSQNKPNKQNPTMYSTQDSNY